MDTSNIWKVNNSYFRDNPQNLVNHHIESYNDFYKKHIFQIFRDKNPIKVQSMYDDELGDYKNKCNLYLGGKDGTKIYFGKPIIYDEGRPHFMYPNEARLRNMTYAMTIHYDVEVEFIKTLRGDEEPDIYGGTNDIHETDTLDGGEFESSDVEEETKTGGAKTDILKKPPRKKPAQKMQQLLLLKLQKLEKYTSIFAASTSEYYTNISTTILIEKFYWENFQLWFNQIFVFLINFLVIYDFKWVNVVMVMVDILY